MIAQLYNDEVFESTSIYCDLARPIVAGQAKSLKLNLKMGAMAGNRTIKLMYEYVHIDA